MRTVTYKSIRDKIFRRRGMDPTATSQTQKDLVADFVTDRIREAWEFAYWKEWTFIEERAYRPLYYNTGEYAKDDEVWDGDESYYKSLADSNTGHALTDTNYWEDISSSVDAYILLDQPGKTRIGAVLGVYTTEAHAQKDICALETYLDTDRIVVTDSAAGATVWVKLRKVPPRFSGEDFNATTAYEEGWIVYYPTSNETQVEGNCYRASLTEGNVEYWEEMEVPAILEQFLVLAGTAEYYRNDTQLERADDLDNQASAKLQQAYEQTMLHNGIYMTARVVVP